VRKWAGKAGTEESKIGKAINGKFWVSQTGLYLTRAEQFICCLIIPKRESEI
jgi:hypothetical protein